MKKSQILLLGVALGMIAGVLLWHPDLQAQEEEIIVLDKDWRDNVIEFDTSYYEWNPQKDITAYELAINLPAFVALGGWSASLYVKNLPETAKRHWTYHE